MFETQEMIDRELASLCRKHGDVTPDMVVAEASKKQHPLHRYFQWNDAKAVHQHRLAIARQMIQVSRYNMSTLDATLKFRMSEIDQVRLKAISKALELKRSAVLRMLIKERYYTMKLNQKRKP